MKRIFILLFSIFMLSCSPDDNNTEVQIRVKNSSQFEYSDVVVINSNYGDISPNTFTEYKTFGQAYRYGFIELEIDNETFTIQPIDFVGETPLSPGKYTYEVGAAENGNQYSRLSLTFIED